MKNLHIQTHLWSTLLIICLFILSFTLSTPVPLPSSSSPVSAHLLADEPVSTEFGHNVSVLYSFNSYTEDATHSALSTPIFYLSCLYGVSEFGGLSSVGALWKYCPIYNIQGEVNTYTETVLHSFSEGDVDGSKLYYTYGY